MSTSGSRSRQSGGECTQGVIHLFERFDRLVKVFVHHEFRESLLVDIELKYWVEHASVDGLNRGSAPDPLKGWQRAREQAAIGRQGTGVGNFSTHLLNCGRRGAASSCDRWCLGGYRPRGCLVG
jgi:hypothetical protein